MTSMLQRIAAAAACALLLACPASAQLIGSGHVLGNGTGSPAAPTDTPLIQIMNQAGSGFGPFTAGLPLIGNGTSGPVVGTKSGTTTDFATISGAVVNGHCPTFNSGNIIDSGGPCSTGTGSGTVAAGSQGQTAGYAAAGTIVTGILECSPIELWGGNGNGSADNTAAFAAFRTAVGTGSACLKLDSGQYNLNTNAIAWTLSCGQHIDIQGNNKHASSFFWPNAGSGLAITYTGSCGYENNPTFNTFNMSMNTGAANGGGAVGLAINGNSTGGTPMLTTSIRDTSFRGIGSGAQWGQGVIFTDVQDVNATNDDVYGCAGCKTGNGIGYIGSTQAKFPTQFFISNFSGFFLQNCIVFSGWVQGLQGTNLTCVAVIGGVIASGSGFDQNQVSIVNCNMDAFNTDIALTNISTSTITGCLLSTNRTGGVGAINNITLVGSTEIAVAGNIFVGNGLGTQNGIECIAGSFSLCVNNMFNNNVFSGSVTNVLMDASATSNGIHGNRSISGAITSGGTGNSIVNNF